MKIDVVVLTKNSEYMLYNCLSSIFDNIPVRNLIVVDGYSTDETINILRKFEGKHGNLKIIQHQGTRASAREIGIENVDTEWFMFVDSDVILCENWFEKALRHIQKDVGAIWGLNIDLIPNFQNRIFYRILMKVALEAFKIRGGMHDTLIRRSAVKNLKIPQYLHTYEDSYIIKFIKNRGFKVIVGDEVFCLHLRPPQDWDFNESISLAAWEMKCGLFYLKAFKYVFYYPFFAFYWLLQRYKRMIGEYSHKGR